MCSEKYITLYTLHITQSNMFRRITIIGLGLIGGSLGLAIKDKRLAKKVVGVSRRRSTILRAKALGIVDHATLDVKEGIKDSDLIILTAPVLKIIDIAKEVLDFAPEAHRSNNKNVIITDVGSTKSKIVETIESMFSKNVDFVGSHPLAGSEKSGVIYADKDLFKGACCILTKSTRTNPQTLNKMKRFWNRLGMKVEIMTPRTHDRVVSRLSHLPHAAAIGLCNVCGKIDSPRTKMGRSLHLAAGGFKDTTRIAAGNPELWKDIFITNRKNIVRDIRVFKKELSRIENALRKGDSSELLRLFKKAKKIRDSI